MYQQQSYQQPSQPQSYQQPAQQQSYQQPAQQQSYQQPAQQQSYQQPAQQQQQPYQQPAQQQQQPYQQTYQQQYIQPTHGYAPQQHQPGFAPSAPQQMPQQQQPGFGFVRPPALSHPQQMPPPQQQQLQHQQMGMAPPQQHQTGMMLPGMPPMTQQPQQQMRPLLSPGPGISYQHYVPGLNGWNDPPKTLFTKTHAQEQAMKDVANPQAYVVSAVSATMERVKTVYENQPGQKRMVEDTEKRMDFLLERLANHQVPEFLVAELVVVFKAMQCKNFATAVQSTTELMTSSIDQETRWIVGMKRLIELAVRLG